MLRACMFSIRFALLNFTHVLRYHELDITNGMGLRKRKAKDEQPEENIIMVFTSLAAICDSLAKVFVKQFFYSHCRECEKQTETLK